MQEAIAPARPIGPAIMTEVARSDHGSRPLTVELLDAAPIGSRLVLACETAGLGARLQFGCSIYDRLVDGWVRRDGDGIAVSALSIIRAWSGWTVDSMAPSWRLHHPGLVKVRQVAGFDWTGPLGEFACLIPGCHTVSSHWDSLGDACTYGRRHIERHARIAGAL